MNQTKILSALYLAGCLGLIMTAMSSGLLVAAAAGRGPDVKRCGFRNPPLLMRRANQARLERRRDRHRELSVVTPSCQELCHQCIPIDVYFHLLALEIPELGVFLPHPTDKVIGLASGSPVTSQDFTSVETMTLILAEQMAYLNQAYNETPFLFKNNNIPLVHSTDNAWTLSADDFQVDISQEYHIGNDTTLNVYLAFDLGDGAIGFATLPSDQLGNQGDGVFMRYDTLPGGGLEFFDLGETFVHEVGHWLGLYHVFQETNGTSFSFDIDASVDDPCDPIHAGDFVADTPQMSMDTMSYFSFLNDLCFETTPLEACNSTCLDYLDNPGFYPDTCVNDDDPDPVFNYMNYLDDACFQAAGHFTCGQVERMYMHYKLFREHVNSCATNDDIEIEIVVSTDTQGGSVQFVLRQINLEDSTTTTSILLDSTTDSINDFDCLSSEKPLVIDLCVPRDGTYELVVVDKPGAPLGMTYFQVWVEGILIQQLEHNAQSLPVQTLSIQAMSRSGKKSSGSGKKSSGSGKNSSGGGKKGSVSSKDTNGGKKGYAGAGEMRQP